jgi:hypothetical protein
VAVGGGKDDRKQNTWAPLITYDPTNQRFFSLLSTSLFKKSVSGQQIGNRGIIEWREASAWFNFIMFFRNK